MRNSVAFSLTITGLSLILAGCGSSPTDRGLSGAAIGAGAGAVIGTVTGVGPGAGALIGGAVGGAAGALTDESQVNLGKPAWRSGDSGSSQPSSAPPQTAYANPNYSNGVASYDTTTVRNIQTGLQRLGYDPGPVDGQFGGRTETAIRKYQQDNNLPVDGQPSASLWDQIRSRIQS